MARALDTERFDDEPGGRGGRVLLLPRHEDPVAHGVRLEAAGDDEVGAGELLGFVLDSERLDPLTDVLIVSGMRAGEAPVE